MSSPKLLSETRDYVQLLEAMNQILAVLVKEGGEQEAIQASFSAAAQGFGAQKALLLLVEEREPLRLRSIKALGDLTAEEIRACERGESVPGVSPSVIQRVIAGGKPELIEHPLFQAGDRGVTPSLTDSPYSILCAPICDPIRETVLAVIYLQNGKLLESYEEADRAWLEKYVAAVGRAFGFYFWKERQACELRELVAAAGNGDAPDILGESCHTQTLRRALHETYIPSLDAESPEPILILGERGTGKDLIARYLHAYSSRRRKPLVVVNCAEITDELAASRFFGHKKGSFTGALTDEPGFFRAANGGILFLDEVAELSLRAQAHLLRVLENHRVVPVGQTQESPVDVAVILATNRDLNEALREGTLRADFYDRFRTLAVRLLPLRDRPGDIPLLLEHFRRHHESRQRKRTLGFNREALHKLVGYGWPGNIRELSRACSLFVIHAKPGGWIDPMLIESCLPEILRADPSPKAGPLLGAKGTMRDAMRSFQRELILSRLELHAGSVKAARESLGLTKPTFHRYMKTLRISSVNRASAE